MAQIINFEAEAEMVELDDGKEDDEASNFSESSVIDDQAVENDVVFYRQFANVENDINNVLDEAHDETLQDIEQFDEISNLDDGPDNEIEIGQFESCETHLNKFKETLFPNVEEEKQKIENQFCEAIVYALRYQKNGKKSICTNQDFEKVIHKDLSKQVDKHEEFEFIIQLQAFLNLCYKINAILSKCGCFLRVFELKNKFHHLATKDKSKQKIIRQLSSCLIEKYSGITIILIENQKKQRKLFNIIYKPTKKIEIEPVCYFSTDIAKAYSSLHSKGKRGLTRSHQAFQCFYCNRFFIVEARQKRHMENSSGKPGVVYNFNNQCLISYRDNFQNKGDIPFTIFFNFETTATTDNFLDPEQKKMFAVSYVMIVAFHPALKLDQIIIYRSFAHPIEPLTTLNFSQGNKSVLLNRI